MSNTSELLTRPKADLKPVVVDEAAYTFSPLALDGLLSAIYDGITEAPPWHDALELLREMTDGEHVTLMLRPPSTESAGVMINTGIVDEQASESYASHFFAVDPFVNLPEGVVTTAAELIGEKQWQESAMYRDYLEPLGVQHLLGADINTAEGIEARLRITRGQESKDFSEEDRNLIRVVLPHLQRAIRLHAKLDYLECERELFSGAVNRLLLGMIRYDQEGAILEMNSEAERILAEKDGLKLSGGQLVAESRDESREMQRLIDEAVAGGKSDNEPGIIEAMSITREFGRSQLGIVVRTIPMGEYSEAKQRPAAAVFLRDPDHNSAQPSQDVVRRVFGLTRMEAALAILLAEGNTLDEAAAKLNVRRNTARTHLRSIFGKTGVTRQTMLVRLLLNSVVSLG